MSYQSSLMTTTTRVLVHRLPQAASVVMLHKQQHFDINNPSRNARLLSTAGASALEKFRHALEEYRFLNYQQETHDRFRKDIVKATTTMTSATNDTTSRNFTRAGGLVRAEEIERLMKNIDASDCLTRQEIAILVKELGDEKGGGLSVNRMMQMLP